MARTVSSDNAKSPAVIDMTVRDDTNFLSPYSQSTRPVIDAGVAEFLSARAEVYPPRTPLALRIHSNCIDGGEQEVYRAAITEHYTEELLSAKREVKRCTLLSVLLGAVGVLVLLLMVLLGNYFPVGVWTEVVDIVAWVFLWEATDLYFLEGHALRARVKRKEAFLNAKIEFFPL